MSLTICILGSGSSGNSTYVASEQTAILIDAGLTAKRTTERLEQIGIAPERLQGICLSHEHNDHTGGLRVLHKRYGIPLYANSGTREALIRDPAMVPLPWNIFTTGAPFQIGDLLIEPFSVPHDAYDPVGFIVHNASARVGVVTDMGMPTALVRERLKRCHAVVLESNHDERLLQDATRPWSLKQRITGRQGHLSNRVAATLAAEIAGPDLRHIFLAHLSEDCNRHDLALETTQTALREAGHTHIRVSLAFPDRISDVWNWS